MSHFDLKPVSTGPTRKPIPKLNEVEFSYSPSPDGIDSNLLIFFHGLGQYPSVDLIRQTVSPNVAYQLKWVTTGDTFKPFAQLGKSLNLPQTAILSLQAPTQIPLLEEPAFQWWESFDNLGESE
jgi:hypothetical protein